MTNGLTSPAVKWLTYLVYGLLIILTIITGWNNATISKLPDNYVRLERYQSDAVRIDQRYQSDTERIDQSLRDINNKLDRLIEKKSGG